MSSNHLRAATNSESACGVEGTKAYAASRPLSIFFLIRSLATGGAQRQLVELACALRERGHHITVATFYSGDPLDAELIAGGVRLIDLRKTGRWDFVGFLWRLRRAITDARPDVVYSFLGGANILAALVWPFVSRTKLVWSVLASDMDLTQYDWVHRLAYRFECRLSGVPDLIISNSRAGVEYAAANGFPRSQMLVVTNGINTTRFRPDAVLRAAQRENWGLTDREIAVGMLARLDPMKGYPTFFEAGAEVGSRRDSVRFVCVGDGEEESRLKQLVVELGISDKVIFAGATANPEYALNGLDIFCSASVTEGFSNSIAEAMACGLRCVVTDVGDSATIIGGCGVVVAHSNPEAMARAIEQQIDALDGQPSSAARARVVDNFSIDLMIERTLGALEQAVAANQGSALN